MGGIRLPGLIVWALSTHPERLPVEFGTVLAPSVRRLPMSLRSGPTTPWGCVPRIVWQPAHGALTKTSWPLACDWSLGAGGGFVRLRAQASKVADGPATTRHDRWACWSPQYSTP